MGTNRSSSVAPGAWQTLKPDTHRLNSRDYAFFGQQKSAATTFFTIITDHNPLVGVFKRDIPDIDNRRLQCFRERLQLYSFTLKWKEGKSHLIADVFSRRPTGPPEEALKLCRLTDIPLAIMPTVKEAANEESYKSILEAIKTRRNRAAALLR